MNFSYDLLLSFSEQDDLGNDEKWVGKLSSYIRIFLEKLLEREPVLIDSKQLSNGELASGDIYSQTKLLLVVASQNFIDSENCHHELRSYLNSLKSSGRDEIAHQRIFVVSKAPIENGQLPDSLSNHFSYDFYDYNHKTKEFFEFVISTEYEDDKRYWLKLSDLAFDMAKAIKQIDGVEATTNTQSDKKTIFLAEPSDDQKENWYKVKRELEHYGHKVVPDFPLSRDYKKMEDQMIEMLNQCELAIHVLGDNNGERLENSETNLVEGQIKISSEFAERFENSSDYFERILWYSPDLEVLDEEQEIFFDKLKNGKEDMVLGELIEIPIEYLKSIVRNKIYSIDEFAQLKDKKRNQRNLYLIAAEGNQELVSKYETFLIAKGFSVDTIWSENPNAIIHEHRMKLSTCDIALIVYHDENKDWLRVKLIDLLKAPGFGRKKPMLGKFLITSMTDPMAGMNYKIDGLKVLEAQDLNNCEIIDPLLADLI